MLPLGIPIGWVACKVIGRARDDRAFSKRMTNIQDGVMQSKSLARVHPTLSNAGTNLS